MTKINIIVAAARNGAIGFKGGLPWHLPQDLEHFKDITWGHTIIMGRKTCFSLPHGALPGRRNIVISHTITEKQGFEVFPSLGEAFKACIDEAEVFIIGGEAVYRHALPFTSKIYLTLVDKEPEEADAFFPTIDKDEWKETKKEKLEGFSFIELERV